MPNLNDWGEGGLKIRYSDARETNFAAFSSKKVGQVVFKKCGIGSLKILVKQ